MNTWFARGRIAAEEKLLAKKADEVLEFLTIDHLADERAGNLSGGQKKLLELGRTMMVDAKIVFLDEVGAGVNRTLLNTIGDAIIRLNKERGYTFCVIEHDMDFIGRLCDPVIVMAEGKVLAEGHGRRDHAERGGDRGLSGHRAEEQGQGGGRRMSKNAWQDDRGNKDRSIANPDGQGKHFPVAGRGKAASSVEGDSPFLIGESDDRRLWHRRRHPARLHHRRGQGRDRGDRRPERRRQVDRDEGGVRHAEPALRARCGSTARTSPRSRRRTAWPRAWPSCRRPRTSSPR